MWNTSGTPEICLLPAGMADKKQIGAVSSVLSTKRTK